MTSNESKDDQIASGFFRGGNTLTTLGPVFCFAILAAGCSADVKRFDGPPFGLTETGSTKSHNTRSGYETSNNSYTRPTTTASTNIQSTDLPDISQRPQSDYNNNDYSYGGQRPTEVAALTRGDRIEVRRGDTLYGLSRRYGVTLSDLMTVNGLTSSELQPGQILYLPNGTSARQDTYQPEPEPTTNLSAPSDWNGTYTVARGDSLYAIARKHGVTVSELQRNNSIDDPRRLRPGAVLRVPGYGSSSDTNDSTNKYSSVSNTTRTNNVHTVNSTPRPLTTMSGQNVDVLNAPTQPGVRTAALSANVETPLGSVTEKLRWPARGKNYFELRTPRRWHP